MRLRPPAGLLRVLLLLVVFALPGCMEELNRGLSEGEANDIVALLLRNGVAAQRTREKDGTLTVTVEGSQFAQAVDLLRANGLPHQAHVKMTDVFKGDGLVSSPTEERARYVYALDETLASTIAQIDGVLATRVHVVLPENDSIRRDPTPSAASVFIRYAPGTAVGEQVPQVKQLVANAVPGLSYDRVSVVIVPATLSIPKPNVSDIASLTNVAGIWVHQTSARTLQLVLAGGAAMLVVLLGAVGWLLGRVRGRASRPVLVPR